MVVVQKRPRARRDLGRLWHRLAEEASPERADAFLNRFERALLDLAALPESAPPTPQYGPGLRRYVFRRRYLVFYRPIPSGIEVIRVLHGAQDIRPGMFS